MARRRFQLTQEQVKELTYAYNCCKDGPTRTRYQAVRLYGAGYPVKEVMEITGCSRPILMEWCRKYRAAEIAALADQRVGGNRPWLSPEQMAQLRTRLHLYTPADLFGKTAATSRGQFWTVPDLGGPSSNGMACAIKVPVPACGILTLVASVTSVLPECISLARRSR